MNDRVLNVSHFLSRQPGGELALLIFAGKDATAEFDRTYPHNVVKKYAPDAIIGVVGSGKAQKVKGAEKSAPVATEKGDAVENLEAWGDWRTEALDDTPGALSVNVRFFVNACYYCSASDMRFVPRFSLRRISRSRMTERGLHEVPFSSSFSLWCMPSGICT